MSLPRAATYKSRHLKDDPIQRQARHGAILRIRQEGEGDEIQHQCRYEDVEDGRAPISTVRRPRRAFVLIDTVPQCVQLFRAYRPHALLRPSIQRVQIVSATATTLDQTSLTFRHRFHALCSFSWIHGSESLRKSPQRQTETLLCDRIDCRKV